MLGSSPRSTPKRRRLTQESIPSSPKLPVLAPHGSSISTIINSVNDYINADPNFPEICRPRIPPSKLKSKSKLPPKSTIEEYQKLHALLLYKLNGNSLQDFAPLVTEMEDYIWKATLLTTVYKVGEVDRKALWKWDDERQHLAIKSLIMNLNVRVWPLKFNYHEGKEFYLVGTQEQSEAFYRSFTNHFGRIVRVNVRPFVADDVNYQCE